MTIDDDDFVIIMSYYYYYLTILLILSNTQKKTFNYLFIHDPHFFSNHGVNSWYVLTESISVCVHPSSESTSRQSVRINPTACSSMGLSSCPFISPLGGAGTSGSTEGASSPRGSLKERTCSNVLAHASRRVKGSPSTGKSFRSVAGIDRHQKTQFQFLRCLIDVSLHVESEFLWSPVGSREIIDFFSTNTKTTYKL